jgi:lysine biosynthesis protein LysW
MIICNECGSRINSKNFDQGIIIECEFCGIELELQEDNIISLQLGPSEE